MEGYTCRCGGKGEFEVPMYRTTYGPMCSNECLEALIEEILGVSVKVSAGEDDMHDWNDHDRLPCGCCTCCGCTCIDFKEDK